MPLATTSSSARPKSRSLTIQLAASVRDHGLPAACRKGWRRLRERVLEWKYGIQTVGSIDAAILNTGSDSFGYQPIPYAALEAALTRVGCGTNDVFVDLGCGMGRAVIVAGLGAFRRVIGVEISPELCTLARRNIDRARRHLGVREVDIMEADAREYGLPDDATVLLLFNPFDEPILRRVLANVHASLERAARQVTIIYAIPNARRDLLADVPWLELREVLPIPDEPWLRLGIYRSRRDVA